MNELKVLLQDIEKLRNNLYKLINENTNLQDPEIISASQILNAAIAKYNDFVEKKTGK
jgi:regulator of replication initiation timing